MNARLIRFVAAVASAAVVSVLGAGMAGAATADRVEAEIAAVGGQSTTHATAGYLLQLHDYLAGAADRDDVAAVRAAVEDLRPVLRVVSKATVERSALGLNDRADMQAAQVERDLPGLSILASVGALVNSLLATLMDLVTGLLGGPPVPVPPVPMPLPPVPDVPAPDVPAPDVPAPDVPAPDVPAPDVPAPDVPAPDVPVPDVPAPDVP